MNKQIEYWYVEYYEKKCCNFGKGTKKATCIARHPNVWLKCKQEFEAARCECGVNVRETLLFEITSTNTITKEDYEIFIK